MDLSRKERRELKREMEKEKQQTEEQKAKRKSTGKTVFYIVIVIVALAAVSFGASSMTAYLGAQPGPYDNFAKCLTEKGVEMYGAYWCPNCQRQKLDFGNSFRFIDYIECDAKDPEGKGQPDLCEQKGITGYPTWIYNDQRLVGRQDIQKLSEFSGCSLK